MTDHSCEPPPLDSLLLSRADLGFLLYDWLQVEALAARSRFNGQDRDIYDACMDTAQRIATDRFAPHNKKGDANEPQFDGIGVKLIPEVKPALEAFIAAGYMSASQDEAMGGMQLPYVVERACLAWFQAANTATAAYPFLTMANANTILQHGSEAQIKAFALPQLEGRYFGTMCLSEPHAGSSLADIRTRAVLQPDGRYRLFGTKMWISAGEHDLSENIIHLVLARIEGAPKGVKGISLFIVPKFTVDADGAAAERNDVVLAGLNHKMGYRGTTNCLLNFGEGVHQPEAAPGALGSIVGAPGQGLAQMFAMMNEARIGVGMGAAVLGMTGYLHALDYCRGRPQGRPLANKDADQPQVPIVAHADVRRMLLAQKAYAEGAVALCLYTAMLVDQQHTARDAAEREETTLLLEMLTPIAKSWPSQWCLEANALAIQCHGGYGYTRDYNVEQFYRDNRLNPIHEGTHGIQGLDLLGRKVRLADGAGYRIWAQRLERTIADGMGQGDPELRGFAKTLQTSLAELSRVTTGLTGAADQARVLANASVYLEAFGHVTLAWIWLDQLLAVIRAGRADTAFGKGKMQAARFFFRWELPKTGAWLRLLEEQDDAALAMENAWF